ncbi:MAG: DegT/DnrJ/EryC1/StrS family aminotransferase [Chitinophagaceae bacterium]
MIPVTKPFAPPIQEYTQLLEGVWQRNWFTNNGPLVNDFELKVKKKLNLPHFLYVSNGTIAIQLAIKALGLKGKIITTPFSYVATTSSIAWENCTPVFADIDPKTFNIDPNTIENCIDEDTCAILATHCFGNPCAITAIEAIAQKHGLKVIYDAAHAFGTTYKGESIFTYGDISTTSFHATKLFHTIEGGGLFTMNPELLRIMAYMRNFGHDGPEHFLGIGINGKNSEFHAAMGLLNLRYVDEIMEKRKELSHNYDQLLSELNITKQTIEPDTEFNYSYYPVLFKDESTLLKMKSRLEQYEIFTRRYFYPTLNSLPYTMQEKAPVAEDISRRILCLPLYHNLSYLEQEMIARIMMRVQTYS